MLSKYFIYEMDRAGALQMLQLACTAVVKMTAKDIKAMLLDSDGYFQAKWKGSGKDFTVTFLNLDDDNQEKFIEFLHEKHEEQPFMPSLLLLGDKQLAADLIAGFFMFANNFRYAFWEKVFGDQADHYIKIAKGKTEGPIIPGRNICDLFGKLTPAQQQILMHYVFNEYNPHWFDQRQEQRNFMRSAEERIRNK